MTESQVASATNVSATDVGNADADATNVTGTGNVKEEYPTVQEISLLQYINYMQNIAESQLDFVQQQIMGLYVI